ncbi:hypothetical protein GIB67_042891 [Kingdonia uniflora]|uniref:DUF4283 domain-containing protein n=1 Tax=Kingdonia uniflora TaxID=39325 RepID=A0A7J7P328_9MAGN|nr:hypothetical protein GIB67_042891 [Kingdonia uniflora]
MPCWVKFPGLGLEFWEEETLMSLGKMIGTPINADQASSPLDFGYFGGVLVDIDLSSLIPSKVLVEVENDVDFWLRVELGKMTAEPVKEHEVNDEDANIEEQVKGLQHFEALNNAQKGIGTSHSNNSFEAPNPPNRGATSPLMNSSGSPTPSSRSYSDYGPNPLVKEANMLMLNNYGNWADMVDDDVRDAALVAHDADCAFMAVATVNSPSTAGFQKILSSPVDKDSPVVPIGRSPRTDILLKAEKEVLEAGGCVLRLAGLYISLLVDAASLAIAIMKKKYQSRIFLGCDNHPLSRQEVMDLVDRSGKFDKKFQCFTGKLIADLEDLCTIDPLGKKLNNSKTRAEVGWTPKYSSFANFLGIKE